MTGREPTPAANDLRWLIDRLAQAYDPAPAPFPTDPFEIVLWENLAFLVNDERRSRAFEALRRSIGTDPEKLLRADEDQVQDLARHGILAEHFATRLRAAAELAWTEFGGDVGAVLAEPPEMAKRALRRFPGIGEPGAEKILLFTRTHPYLAPETNGLRVLLRFGVCREQKSSAATYAAAREAAQAALGDDFDVLIAARHYLRLHGQKTCRRTAPQCGRCLVRERCPFPRRTP